MADSEYERGFKDGLKSECLKELKPLMVELAKGCTEAIKGIPPMLIDNAQLTIRHVASRWISVEDALPEKDKSYITYAETTKYCNHNEIPEEVRINVLYFNGEEWYDEECKYYNVTHYMPLPEPPEKE